ncbi:Protein Y71G12B.6 [Aphelenchoides avenae]|nr:Protein Y71G12B.6 [Aphelenchus avenae]
MRSEAEYFPFPLNACRLDLDPRGSGSTPALITASYVHATDAVMTLSSTALIVGGLTPLGAAFARYLTGNGAPSVIVYDNCRAGQKNEELAETATVVLGSVKNEQLLARALNENKVESVFYFPQGLCDPASQETDPVKSAREITVGVTHLLDAVRKAPSVKVIVLASSLEVYGPTLSDQSAGPLEKTTLRPQSAFAAALMGAESMLHAYAMSYRLNIKIARLPTTVFWSATPPANVPAQVADAAVNGSALQVDNCRLLLADRLAHVFFSFFVLRLFFLEAM